MAVLRWMMIVIATISGAAGTSIVRPAYGQTAQTEAALERPETPDVVGAHVALHEEFDAYAACVHPKKIEAIALMWERRAPIDAALHDISHAYRQCEGFQEFWAALYFLGYDSPEQWIEREIRVVKTVAAARAETDVETLRTARAFIRSAWEKAPDSRRLDADQKAQAREALYDMMYVVDALRPRDGDMDAFKPLVEHASDAYLVYLPEAAEEALAQALAFAERDEEDAQDLLDQVKRDALRRR